MARSDRKQAENAAAKLPTAGYWIAEEPLTVGGVRAFNPGDRVPAEHVERFGWHDKVRDPDA